MRIKYICSVVILLISLATTLTTTQPRASAVSANDWQAGNIIDDSIFTNANSMSVEQIQAFLNAQVPNCDTNGTLPATDYGRSDLTHAQYAALKGWAAPPYVCLRNYYEVPKTSPGAGLPDNSYSHGGGSFPGGVSAAQLILNAAQQYQISPKVLLVKIRGESAGPLTGDSWPLRSQYTYAMGAHCPDSGPNNSANCDPNYSGFSIQISEAAALLRYYLDSMSQPWWPYKKVGINNILYSPNASCGSSNVTVVTQSTAALYTYTPYQPNAAALAAGYGTAPCGAYGNRNFWLYFNEWFGSTNYSPPGCNSRVSNVTCVWQLYNESVTTDSDFLTTNTAERDAAVNNNLYAYSTMPFYAFGSQQNGTIPVYRIRLPNEHFYTANDTEKNSLLQNNQNTYEGVAFYMYPASSSTNASYPVHRLSGPLGHIYVTSDTRIADLVSQGYTDEGVTFNAPSGLVQVTDPPINYLNVYRLNGKTEHFYTMNLGERDALLNNGWSYEGILAEASSATTNTPVYRLFNNNYHMFTTSAAERDQLVRAGWSYESIAWYVDSSVSPVYRFYFNGGHFFTNNFSEALGITNRGGQYEGLAFGYSQASSTAVYRFFDGVRHFYTASQDESLSIANSGWKYEGIGWYGSAIPTSSPVYRLSLGTQHFYTANTTERDQLVNSGWKYEGIGWYGSAIPTSSPVYRLYGGAEHFFTTGTTERDQLVNSGWKYEGIGWYGME
jgi:hypothetical protein